MDNNELPFSTFHDLSKAFDTLDHNILLCKLNHYDIERVPLKIYESYLSNRTHYVEIDDVKSETLPRAKFLDKFYLLSMLMIFHKPAKFSTSYPMQMIPLC